MKPITLILLALSPLMALAESALRLELLPPTEPVHLVAEQKEILTKVRAAQMELKEMRNGPRENHGAKPDLKRMMALEKIIRQGQELEQGITLRFRLHNNSDEEITIFYGADTSTNTLAIKGPGALPLEFHGAMTADYRQGTPTTIAAGKSVTLTIAELRYGSRDASRWLLTEAGEYEITLSLRTRLGDDSLSLKSNTTTLEVRP